MIKSFIIEKIESFKIKRILKKDIKENTITSREYQ